MLIHAFAGDSGTHFEKGPCVVMSTNSYLDAPIILTIVGSDIQYHVPDGLLTDQSKAEQQGSIGLLERM